MGMYEDSFNKAKPAAATLQEWDSDTTWNRHSERLVKVAKWARENARPASGLLETFTAIERGVVNVKTEHDRDGYLSWENGMRRNRLMNVLHAAIRMEYGKETATQINAN